VGKAYDMLSKIFKEEGEGIILSSIHKSKGLEANFVYLIRKDLIPSKYATQEWSLIQERNLLFVAYTRAKESLIFVTDWNDEKQNKLQEIESRNI
jgi:DNA helicase II / ATP-dependent DNA helicase PcrA